MNERFPITPQILSTIGENPESLINYQSGAIGEVAKKIFDPRITQDQFDVLSLLLENYDISFYPNLDLNTAKTSLLRAFKEKWTKATLIDLSILLGILLSNQLHPDSDLLQQLSPKMRTRVTLFASLKNRSYAEQQTLINKYQFIQQSFYSKTWSLVQKLIYTIVRVCSAGIQDEIESYISKLPTVHQSELDSTVDLPISANPSTAPANRSLDSTNQNSTTKIYAEPQPKVDLKHLHENTRHVIALKVGDTEYHPTLRIENRTHLQILSDVEYSYPQPRNITFAEMESVARQSDMTLTQLKLWILMTLRQVMQPENFGSSVSYKRITTLDENSPYAFSMLLCEFQYECTRKKWSIYLRQAFTLATAIYNAVLTQQVDISTLGFQSQVYVCRFCGMPQAVQIFDGSPQLHACSTCSNQSDFYLYQEKNDKASPINHSQLRILLQLQIGNFLTDAEIRKILVENLSPQEIKLWIDRALLHLFPKTTKLPHQSVTTLPEAEVLASEALSYLKRRHKNISEALQYLLPEPGNRYQPESLIRGKIVYCYCSNCKDVWMQPLNNGGEALIQRTENPLYNTQLFDLPAIACKSGRSGCDSASVHLSADFHPDWRSELPEFKRIADTRTFFVQHFTIEELMLVIARMTGSLSAYEDLGGESNIESKLREGIGKAMRINSVAQLFGEILAHQVDSLRHASHVAVKCAYCNSVVATRMNREGQVLLDYCPTCGNIEHWQAYSSQVDTIKPNYDLYEAFSGKAIGSTILSNGQQDMTVKGLPVFMSHFELVQRKSELSA